MKNIYTIRVISQTAPEKIEEVDADDVEIKDGAYVFKEEQDNGYHKLVAAYPVGFTIISSIVGTGNNAGKLSI